MGLTSESDRPGMVNSEVGGEGDRDHVDVLGTHPRAEIAGSSTVPTAGDGMVDAPTAADDEVAQRESRAAFLKEIGNASYKEGNYANALEMYTSAIELCPTMALLWCNRSMCHAALGQWKESVSDAQSALKHDDKYEKAWYRLVKGLLELKRFREAGQNLLVAYKVGHSLCCLTSERMIDVPPYHIVVNHSQICGEKAPLRALESEYFTLCQIYLRPNPNDFDVKEELGDGNFSKIYKATLKSTGAVYAIKVIQCGRLQSRICPLPHHTLSDYREANSYQDEASAS
jgi:tetratricopeptide (TPR) repeat protein